MNPEELARSIGHRLQSSSAQLAGEQPARPAPPPIPDHELLRRVGAGSYGEVWLAQGITGRLRAVKVVWRSNFSSDRPYEREFRGIVQFEPISRSHPGVINILHVGRDEVAGCFFYVMELADAVNAASGSAPQDSRSYTGSISRPGPGMPNPETYAPRTLASDLDTCGRLPVADVLALGVQLAGALGHLHRHGLVHRDVKPSNVIYVGGQPKLADIGLVAGVDEARSFVGTEGFIPPEGPGSERADLFSLGRLLYEAGTGKDRCDFPELPADLDRWPGPEREALLELNEVLSRACAPDPQRRHANAGQFGGDLSLILAGRSVRRVYGVERQVRRVTVVAALAILVAIVAIVAIAIQRRQQDLSEARAQHEKVLRERAEAAEREGRQQLYTALLEQARATVRSGELGQRVQALAAVQQAAAISNTVELRREAVAALALPDLRFQRRLPTPVDCTMTALDPKFERLALCRGTNAVEIQAVFDQRLLATLSASTNEPATFGKWSPNGQFFVVRRSRGVPGSAAAIEVWDVPSARQVLLLPVTPLGAFSFHPFLPRVLCGDTNNSVSVWDMETGAELAKFAVTGMVHHLEFSPDGKSFVVQHRIDRPWFTSLHDATSGIVRTSALSGWVDGIAWHPQDRWVAFAARAGEIHLHDRKTGSTSILGHHKNEARTAVFSPDGDFLFTGGEEQEIICWDLRTMQRAFIMGLQSARLQFRADGEQCAVETKAGLLLHAFERSMPYRTLAGDLGGHIRRAVLSPNGRWLAVSGGLRLGVWDLTHAAPPVIAAEAEQATPLFSPDTSELFAFWANSWSNCFVRWRIGPGASFSSPPKLESLPAPNFDALPVQKPWRVLNAAFTPNALVVSIGSGVVVMSGQEVWRGPGRFFRFDHSRAEVSPDGHWLATGKSGVLDVIGLHPWTRVVSREFESDLLAMAFGPRSDELAIAAHTGVTFLETNRWGATRRFPVMLDRNARLMFTPDGHGFWLAQDARTAALHDTETFATVLPLPNGIAPLAVSPDGRHIVITVDGERLQVWDLAQLRERLQALGVNW